MTNYKAVFSEHRVFFTGYFIFLLAGFIMLTLFTKANSFIVLNPYHSKPLDLFFTIYTNAGDGLFSIGIFLVLLLLRKPLPAWEIVITFLLSGLIAQVVKYFFPMPRPKTFLENSYPHFIDGVTHVGNASFPSGHSASVFGLATILALFTKNKKMDFLYLFLAILVCYSRIYLGQHFVQDVIAGALIGVVSAMIVYTVIENKSGWFRKMKANKQLL